MSSIERKKERDEERRKESIYNHSVELCSWVEIFEKGKKWKLRKETKKIGRRMSGKCEENW